MVKTAAVLAPAHRLARLCSLCARAAACIRALYHRVSPQFLNNPETILKISKFSFYSTSFSTGNPVPNLLPAVEAYSRPFLPTCDPLPAVEASSQALPLSLQLSPSRRSVFQALSPDLRPSPSCQSVSRPFLPTCDPLPAAKASSQALPLSLQISPSRRSVFQALSPDLRPSPSCRSIISGPSPQLPTFSQPSKRDFPAPGAAKSCFERKVPAPPEHCKKPLHDRQYTGQEGPSAFIQRVCYMVLRLRIINPFAPTTGEKHWGHANKEAGTPAISARTEHGKSFPRK